MTLLFDDRLAPITSSIGFLAVDVQTAATAFELWMGPILKNYDCRLIREMASKPVDQILLDLQPLTSPVRTKYLFVPTLNGWTAFFDNGWQGADAAGPMQVLAGRLTCRSLAITATPHTMPSKPTRESKGRYGASIFELYGPDGEYMRTIYAVNDGGRWDFGQSGDPLEFEDVDRYTVKRKKDRFTHEMLDEYLKAFGIEIFDESFYQSMKGSLLIHKKGSCVADIDEYRLEDVHDYFGMR